MRGNGQTSIDNLVDDLQEIVETGLVPSLLHRRSTLLDLQCVDRRACGSKNVATRTVALAEVLKDAITALDDDNRRINRYLLGVPPHDRFSGSERKKRAASEAHKTPDYFRKAPMKTALEAVAFKLLELGRPSERRGGVRRS